MKRLGVKERIIDSASQLFYFQGYNQTGINQIIDVAGVAKASMYQYFRSKEDIAVTYLKRRHVQWMSDLQEYVDRNNDERGKILGCFEYLNDWLVRVGFRGCGWQNIIADLPYEQVKIRDQAIFHKNEFRIYIRNLIKEQDKYTDIESEILGDEILILIEGAIILSQIHKHEWPIKSAKSACIKLLT